jgi:hypothetical protein
MTQASGTFSTYDSNRLREEFANAIYTISPEETPFMSLVDRESVVSKHPEWSTDSLASPSVTNQAIEGDEFAYTAPSATTRIGNYTEIATKQWLITRTDEKASKAGPKSELGYYRRKAGLELKTDMEVALIANKASVAGTDTAARKLAGFAAWITTNDSRGASGADGGFSGGIVAVGTNGTQRAFSKALLDTVLLAAYTAGGSPSVAMMSPYNKQVFSSFMQGANTSIIYSNVKGSEQATIHSAADTYRSDFGVIDVVPNRQMARLNATACRNVLLIDTSKVAVGIFDDVHEVKPAITGDAEKRVLIVEYTLIMKNEAAHGIIADTFGASVST